MIPFISEADTGKSGRQGVVVKKNIRKQIEINFNNIVTKIQKVGIASPQLRQSEKFLEYKLRE